MKYFTLAVFAWLSMATFSNAQITITNSDMPGSGDTIRLSLCTNFAGIAPAVTGANHTWNFSTLTASSQTVDTFVSYLSTGAYLFYFAGASFALKSNTPPVTASGITVDYQYDFFIKSSSAYVLMGLGASVSSLPIGIVNSPRDTLYRFPLNYNYVGSTASSFATTIPGIGYYGGNRTRIDTVDGWGTLITPYGTYNALRLKSVITEIDSIYITTFSTGFTTPPIERTEYKWLANGKKVPLLQITTSAGAITQVIYRDSLRSQVTSLQDFATPDASMNIYPNPAEEEFTVYSLPAGQAGSQFTIRKAQLFNLQGEKVIDRICDKNCRAEKVDISRLSPGVYFVKVITDKGEVNRKLIKE